MADKPEKKIKRRDDGTFKSGSVPNPDGRPEGSVSIVAALRRKLKEKYPDDSDAPNEERRTYLEKIIQTYFDKAIEQGDVRMLKDITDRVDGKAVKTVNANIENDDLAERNQALVEAYKGLIEGQSDE